MKKYFILVVVLIAFIFCGCSEKCYQCDNSIDGEPYEINEIVYCQSCYLEIVSAANNNSDSQEEYDSVNPNALSVDELYDGYFIKSDGYFYPLKELENISDQSSAYIKRSTSISGYIERSSEFYIEESQDEFMSYILTEGFPEPINTLDSGDELIYVSSEGEIPTDDIIIEFEIGDKYLPRYANSIEIKDGHLYYNLYGGDSFDIIEINGSTNFDDFTYTIIEPQAFTPSAYIEGKQGEEMTVGELGGTQGTATESFELEQVLCTYAEVVADSINPGIHTVPYGEVQDGYIVLDVSSLASGYYYFHGYIVELK